LFKRIKNSLLKMGKSSLQVIPLVVSVTTLFLTWYWPGSVTITPDKENIAWGYSDQTGWTLTANTTLSNSGSRNTASTDIEDLELIATMKDDSGQTFQQTCNWKKTQLLLTSQEFQKRFPQNSLPTDQAGYTDYFVDESRKVQLVIPSGETVSKWFQVPDVDPFIANLNGDLTFSITIEATTAKGKQIRSDTRQYRISKDLIKSLKDRKNFDWADSTDGQAHRKAALRGLP